MRRAARAALPGRRWRTWRGFGLRWDAPPLYQSERTAVYQSHLERLRAKGLIYPCFCTRAQLQQQASAAPNLGDTQRVYAGTCAHLTREEIGRLSLARSPALRVRVPDEEIRFVDGLQGPQCENLARDCGDFIVRRSDGLFGYQLAVVVDDALTALTRWCAGATFFPPRPGRSTCCASWAIPCRVTITFPCSPTRRGGGWPSGTVIWT